MLGNSIKISLCCCQEIYCTTQFNPYFWKSVISATDSIWSWIMIQCSNHNWCRFFECKFIKCIIIVLCLRILLVIVVIGPIISLIRDEEISECLNILWCFYQYDTIIGNDKISLLSESSSVKTNILPNVIFLSPCTIVIILKHMWISNF